MTDPHRLDEQVAIVTGAAQGIGKGIALVLAEAGAKIVIGDLQDASGSVDEIRAAGGQSVSMVMDTSKPDDDTALIDFAVKEFGRLDILVNNAAIDAPSGNVWDLPDADWERTIGVNLSGVFYCSRAALVPMLKAGSGVIVNMSSVSAKHAAKGMSPAYNASKAGVLGLTAAFAEQVTEKGVRVNAVMPALVESRDFGWSPEERARQIAPYPMGPGQPRDIGEAIRYLVSPAARWVSGTTLPVTGGVQRGSSVF
ncbi:MAG: SDR family NAD(P)-dependent oxidoreductase [Dehalococcoidia bacterium]|jgi:3-oxoacyl-[acyl-carrier protein] reductase|nr:SDR family NAD(P)-dependent oxidoreductase [Dehalococcoidia bacterium]